MTNTIFDKGGSIWGSKPPVKRKQVCIKCEKIFEVVGYMSVDICEDCRKENKYEKS